MNCSTNTTASTSLGGTPKTETVKVPPVTEKKYDVTDPLWAWVVTFAAFILLFLTMTPTLSFGVMFSEFLLDLGTSSTMTSWIFNLSLLTSGVVSYLVGPVGDEFGWRIVTFGSGLMLGLGIIISAFATSASFLIFSFSFITGSNLLLMGLICYVVTSHYCVRWRILCNALMSTGSCFNQMVMPPVITYLQDEFGFTGATLILGALTLNCCVAAMVLHPVEWHRKDSRPTGKEHSTSVFSVMESLVWRAITLGLAGFGFGITFALNGVLVVEELGLHLLRPTLSLTYLIVGIMAVVISPLSGVIRDASGSYVASLCFFSACLLFGATLGLFLPLARRLQQQKEYQPMED